MDNSHEDQRFEELHLEEEEFDAGTSQRRRGPSVPKWMKQLCSFDSSEKCVSDHSSAFSKYVASEVKDPRHLPLAKDWHKIDEEDKEVLWNRIKEVAEKNKINRQLKTMNHATGTKSFARVQQEYRKKHGKEVDPVTFFHECHTRKDETWVDETSERTWATMESNLQTLIESCQEDNEDLRTRVYVDTMGPERHNIVRGYGHKLTPDMVSYASSSSSTSVSSMRSSKSTMALLMTQNNELKMRDENNNKWISDLGNRQSQLFAMFFQRFQPQPPYNPGTQQSGQSQPPHPPQQLGQSQHPPVYPYAGHNQQPPYPYHMYLMPTQPMTYMQQLLYQVPVYRPKIAAPSGFCSEVPAGGFSRILVGAGFNVDLMRLFGSDGGSQGREGSGPCSGADSVK